MSGTMKDNDSFFKSHYSSNFNSLKYYGAWPIDTKNEKKRKYHEFFQKVMLGVSITLIYSFARDFYASLGDFKKMSWNICVTSLFSGAVIKLLLVYRKCDVINDLRHKLHDDMESRTDAEDVAIQEEAVMQLKKTRKFLYAGAFSFGCVWQVSRYMSKYAEVKLLPIPLALPLEIDLNVSTNFDIVFFILSSLGVVGLYFIVEQEMAMFSLLLQLKREYDILLKDIRKLKVIENIDRYGNCMNPWLRKAKAKNALKQLSNRQKTVMRYADTFENCYNQAMVVQILIIFILCVSIGLQCIMFSTEYLDELSYQSGYLSIVLTDMYLLCFIGSTLNAKCREVGHALYDTFWYTMDRETQKDFSFMILISQRPPRLTCLKAIDIDLRAFMSMMKNIYSWLALFRQVAFKTNL